MKRSLFLVLLAAVMFTGCCGLSYMKCHQDEVRYQATPNPVETRDNKVVVKFVGQYPKKYFAKGVAMYIQPVFTWDSGSIVLEPMTVKGEDVSGNAPTINYASGGRFTYTDQFDFRPGMETGKVTLVPIGYKADAIDDVSRFADDIIDLDNGKSFDEVLISDGVNNTSQWIDIHGTLGIAPINYNKTEGVVDAADIYFPNGQWVLNWNFPMNIKYNALESFKDLKRVMLEKGLPKQINVTGWASPEGEERLNAGVSKGRADVATDQIKLLLDDVLTIMARRAKVKEQDIPYYKYNQMKQVILTTRAAGEDWVHFTIMVEESDIYEKDAVINVVQTQQNLMKREQMLRNMAQTYPQLNEEIFPSIRRAQIALYYSEARKSDPELLKQAQIDLSRLSYDELMYVAYINYNYETKMKYYKWATEHFPEEWSAWNNAGAVAFYLDDLAESERYLNVARELNAHNPDVLNNLGLLYMGKQDYQLAKHYFDEAISEGSTDAENNLLILDLKRGNYEDAIKELKKKPCSFNLAYVQMANNETNAAIRTLDCCMDQTAEVNYLRAICYARLGDKANTLKNLKASVDQEYDYKMKAVVDVEFRAWWDDVEFKEIVKCYSVE
ncbi:MAG: hypothetical protein KBT04_06015 [Bacteroidales bacterium]|nr:hypothetical protein [Candidatus Colimorpha onthohippi]